MASDKDGTFEDNETEFIHLKTRQRFRRTVYIQVSHDMTIICFSTLLQPLNSKLVVVWLIFIVRYLLHINMDLAL